MQTYIVQNTLEVVLPMAHYVGQKYTDSCLKYCVLFDIQRADKTVVIIEYLWFGG